MELKSTVGLNKTIEDIKKGTLVPVYLIFGDEDYLVKEAAQRIIDTILPGKGRELNLETREGDEEDWDKIIQSLNTFPLFGSGRVIAVKDTKVFISKFTSEDMLEKCRERFKAGDLNEAVRIYRVVLGYKGLKDITDKSLDELPGFTGDPKNVDWLNAMVREFINQGLKPILYEDNSDKLDKVLKKGIEGKGIPKGNVLVLTAEHVDKRKKLLKTINDIGIIIDFSIQRMRRDPAEIEDEEKRTLQQQANELLKETGKKLTKGAFDALLAKTGYDVGMFLNELAKVIVSIGDRQQIEPRDIEEIVG
jgi:DNA polymerase III delta subunit